MPPVPDRRQCIVFFTHIWSPRIARHYARLQAEAGPLMPVYLACHLPDHAAHPPEGMQPDIVVRRPDAAGFLPRRHAIARESATPWGYVDLFWLSAFRHPLLAAAEHLWLVEYDVDFSGDWAEFFGPASTYGGDVLASRVHRLSQNPRFHHARGLRQPAPALDDPPIAFFPISRFSRRAIDTYIDALQSADWDGHFEILLPTVMERAGLEVADFGGHGPFTPAERVGHNYVGARDASRDYRSTHGFRPARGFHYFVDRPDRFAEPGRIYHPIKSELSARGRLKHRRQQLSNWWVRLRDTITGRRTRRDRVAP